MRAVEGLSFLIVSRLAPYASLVPKGIGIEEAAYVLIHPSCARVVGIGLNVLVGLEEKIALDGKTAGAAKTLKFGIRDG